VLTTLAVQGYRSLRDVVLPLGPLTAVTGPNGSGKSNLYRALRLVAEASRNGGRRPGPRGRPALHPVGRAGEGEHADAQR